MITLGYVRLHLVSRLALETLLAELIKSVAMLEKSIWQRDTGSLWELWEVPTNCRRLLGSLNSL